MLYKSQLLLLRVALLSKGIVTQSTLLPNIKQISLTVKAENTYDPINNLSLLISLTGNVPKFTLVNRKQSLILPHVILSGQLLKFSIDNLLVTLINRLADKMIAINFNKSSNKFTFVFKASDAITTEMRKFWKLLGSEIGMFSCEITVVTTSTNPNLNETLLRGYQLPVMFSY